MKRSELLDEMAKTYNGYSWNGRDFVYNPFSLQHFLQAREFKHFWAESGIAADQRGDSQTQSRAVSPAGQTANNGARSLRDAPLSTTSWLVKAIRSAGKLPQDLSPVEVNESFFDKFDIRSIDLVSLLFQTGYLTIKRIDPELGAYTLAYPNGEVEAAFMNNLIWPVANS